MTMPVELDLLLRVLLMLFFVLNIVLALVWIERKLLGRLQQRIGPMRVGPHGLLQSPADAIKLLVKEDLTPRSADRWVFQAAPYVVFVPIFLAFVTLPFTGDIVIRNLDLGLFYFVAVTSFSIVGFFMAGWSSDNKYALLGAARAVAQLVSYELPLVLAVLGVAMFSRSLDLRQIVLDQAAVPYLVLQPLGLWIFLVAALAEVNRTPFDIPLAESEVMGGPFIEYSGMRWGVFFLAEYANTFAIASLGTVAFLGGWLWPLSLFGVPVDGVLGNLVAASLFLLKALGVIVVIFWLRGTLPRLRIDQLMDFAWKLLIPITLLNLLVTGLHVLSDWHPAVMTLLSLAMASLTFFIIYQRPRSLGAGAAAAHARLGP
ncbi:MAG: NADH-quinone oxidoreductase subunit NuoH [Chloroflexi bacterium]|nr:NADH-quinone oxidoreductase subunit NuoH [Chloroflexota bacterium]